MHFTQKEFYLNLTKYLSFVMIGLFNFIQCTRVDMTWQGCGCKILVWHSYFASNINYFDFVFFLNRDKREKNSFFFKIYLFFILFIKHVLFLLLIDFFFLLRCYIQVSLRNPFQLSLLYPRIWDVKNSASRHMLAHDTYN